MNILHLRIPVYVAIIITVLAFRPTNSQYGSTHRNKGQLLFSSNQTYELF